MCRLVAYLGEDVLLEKVLVKPINSIVMQSLHARESAHPTNGDGFGLGWYVPEISEEPAIFKSISPAWSDMNLLNLTAKIKSSCFFAHVRAASISAVMQSNCHPFSYKDWMLMHNGEIYDFLSIKRPMRRALDDELYNWIQGTTDSEHFFALFLQLVKGSHIKTLSDVAEVLKETFKQVSHLLKKAKCVGPSYFNLCLTDGKRLLASRYCTDENLVPETMHYSVGTPYTAKNGSYHMKAALGAAKSLLLASERLTNVGVEWHDVPPNHLVLVEEDLSVELRPI